MPFQPKEWEPNPRWVPKEERRRRAAQGAPSGPGTLATPTPATPTAATPRDPSEARRGLIIFGISFAAFLLVALYVRTLNAPNPDALTRTLDAHNVLYSRDPHLGAIGFTWPPLPTALRLPLLMALHPFGVTAFVGPLTSVIAAAGCVVLLDQILGRFSLDGRTRAAWIAVTLANPIVVLHFTNGTAEAIFAFLFLAVIRASLRLMDRPDLAVQGMGLAAGTAIWVRYEALATALAAGASMLAASWLRGHRERQRTDRSRVSLLITLMMPPVFFGGLWLVFNWLIQGDPLYFYTSTYSIQGALDVAQNQPDHPLAFAYGSVRGTLRYVFTRTMEASFLYPLLVVAALVVAWRERQPLGVVLVMLTASTLALQAYQAYTGSIAPWLRYWVYVPVLALLLLGWLAQQVRLHQPSASRRALRWLVIPALIVATNGVAFAAMRGDTAGVDERIFTAVIVGRPDIARDLRTSYPDPVIVDEIVADLDEREGLVILDMEHGAPIILASRDARRFVINTDRDFASILGQPDRTARWLLLPDPREESDLALARDEIYLRFGPGIWEGAPWLMLAREFDGDPDWRLYEIIGPIGVPSTAPPDPAAAPETSPTAAPDARPGASGMPSGEPSTSPPRSSP
ncbi:MAG: hypothetical protein AMXMBFR23_03920 [Chloroflexota bacterium]